MLETQGLLFDIPDDPKERTVKLKQLRHPIWTENKSRLIAKYLQYFVFITKHGIYIDGFAGPQQPKKEGLWTAELVMNSDPKRITKFFLCELNKAKVKRLEDLKKSQPQKPKRTIEIVHGDCNIEIPQYLTKNPIPEKKATFCLLDQRTFECHWETVKFIAEHKREGMKIEQFYFLANSWMDRSFAGTKNIENIRAWWGGDGWQEFKKIRGQARAAMFEKRFKEELGYVYVMPYPILERKTGGQVMYWMIHASDHPEAPKLMWRAYHKAVTVETPEQIKMDLTLAS